MQNEPAQGASGNVRCRRWEFRSGGTPDRASHLDRHHAALIGDIARAEGEELRDPETALSCLQVFALGGLKGETDAANSGYFAVRGLLAKSVAEAARFIVDRGVLAEGGPVLVRLLAQIASRFGIVVTQKVAAQAVPVIGALGGAAVNYAFIDHFQEIARAHFTVRRLERRYGKDVVRMAYDKLSGATPAAA
jgi:EcsC protein family